MKQPHDIAGLYPEEAFVFALIRKKSPILIAA
jgi:hypothetical protein